jgi:thiosulfate reductase cytochrome b subunit
MRNHRKALFILLILALAGSVFAIDRVLARRNAAPTAQASPIHPDVALLDADGQNVLESGNPVSTIETCGECHDTEFIASHSFHADLGWSDFTEPGNVPGGRPWDQSPGMYGKWSPLTYRLLSPEGDERLDLNPLEWTKFNAARLAGGGPLVEVLPDGQELEMNCFLCHLPDPNLEARTQAIQSGNLAWANTAALLGSGLVEAQGDGFSYTADAFAEDGKLTPEQLRIQDPSNENCAQCHGVVHNDTETPLTLENCSLDDWQTVTTGQVISPQKISASGVNLANKAALTRTWDVHTERGLQCTDCHYSLNNPIYYQASGQETPEHLQFDPRRLDLGEYLQKPDHNLARGQSAQFTVAPELKGTMRRCESCHNAVDTHDWLPYAERHMQELACESCHAPQLYAPAVQMNDWTTLTADGAPLLTCRGVETSANTEIDLVTGFTPVLMPRENIDGGTPLAPYNLAASWYWVYQAPDGKRPVRLEDLQAAYFENGAYAPQVVLAFDENSDGVLNETELRIDTPEKEALIAGRLAALGLEAPYIRGEVQPYSINHNITGADWATKDCQACHNDESKLAAPITLASYTPGGVQPEFVQDANTLATGELVDQNGALSYQPSPAAHDLYIFGHSRVQWVDLIGGLFFLAVLAGVGTHATLRFLAARKAPRHTPELEKVYMYGVYERFWHWLQTFAIILLLVTGLVIHRPDIFGFFNYAGVVTVHNVLAALLVLNAALSLFYHLTSGEIRQFIPRPYGFFDQAIMQAKFYMQGIFKGKEHPFEKTPQKKLNPLQQATYFGILNVLLPLQIITGALMWGVQRWPVMADLLGGLPFLAPFHSLIAWLFAGFIVAHVYLTTTGPEPLTSIKAMINGWEDVEVPGEEQEAVAMPSAPPVEADAGDIVPAEA